MAVPNKGDFIFPHDIPENVNWSAVKGVLNEVRDQRKCNCCWAMVACGVISSCYKLKHMDEDIMVLSPQDLVNCMEQKDPEKIQENGCFTSSINRAFRHIMTHGVRYDCDCKFLAEKKYHTPPPQAGERFFKIRKFFSVSDKDVVMRERTMIRAVSKHPIAAMITVNRAQFQKLYKKPTKEIFVGLPRSVTEKKGKKAVFSHAILIVGYGFDEEANRNFWIIQNSQGIDWANEGFLRVCRDSSLPEGYDPLISRASHPVLF